jgi:hypothetical protein
MIIVSNQTKKYNNNRTSAFFKKLKTRNIKRSEKLEKTAEYINIHLK